MFSTQQLQSYQPTNPPLVPQPTARPMTILFQDAPFISSRKSATMSEIRKAAEDFVPLSYPEHTELPFHGKRHPY